MSARSAAFAKAFSDGRQLVKVIGRVQKRSIVFLFLFKTSICYKVGLENIDDNLIKKLSGSKVALVTNQSGVDSNGVRGVDLLNSKFNIKYILVPEHGFGGKKAGERVDDSIDSKLHIKIVSLYQGHDKSKTVPKGILSDFDVFIFDMQDCGMRHYTYISTMLDCMKSAQQNNKKFIVLDRPNPLGIVMQGPLVEKECESFVSIAPIPLRHGMTIGEIAKYFNKFILDTPIDLEVIKVANYKRDDPFVFNKPLSPRLNTPQSVHGYSFLCLFEAIDPFVIKFSDSDSFQTLALPKDLIKNDWRSKALDILKKRNMSGTKIEYDIDNASYLGIRINIKDPNKADSFGAFIDLIELFKELGVNFKFKKIFDLYIGTRDFKKFLLGEITKEVFFNSINKKLDKFFSDVKSILIYDPVPKVVYVKKV